MAQKRSKGICFRCDEKFAPGHICASKNLQVLLVGDEEEDEDSDPKHVHLDSVEVSLNFVMGFTTPRTMKIQGKLGDRDVIVLIDCGATHNFLSIKFVNDLGLVVVLTLHELQVVDDFYPLELGSTYMILGIKWLQTLGDMTMNWKEPRMTFVKYGRSVTIKEETGLSRTLVSLKSMVRSLQKEKKGFLVEMKQLDDTQAEATTTETSFDIGGLLVKYEDVFNLPSVLPPSRDHEHSIVLKDGTMPISVRPYHYPHIQKNEIKKLVKEMLATGVIQPSLSPLMCRCEVFSIWKAFGGNTRDLGSFGEETDKTTDLHQHLSRLYSQRLEKASQNTRDAVTTHLMTVSQDFMTVSACTTQPKI
ncbi:hypothetical protein Tco_1454938 [Tanacetum coccineum]